MSNQRQLGLAAFTYAGDYRGAVPIGHEGVKQFNYLLYNHFQKNNGIDGIMAFGRLWVSGILPGPEGYYCPTDSIYDLDWNPWPPRSDPSLGTRSDYSSRPADGADWSGSDGWPNRMPVLQDLSVGNVTILADRTSSPSIVRGRHNGDGLNRTRIDGSSNSVPYAAIQEPVEDHNPGPFSGANDDAQMRIWTTMDAY
jgi:hypothetical protein